MLDVKHLPHINNAWERTRISELCGTCETWRDLAEIYYERNYHQSMLPTTTSAITFLAFINPSAPPVEEEPAPQVDPAAETPETTALTRRAPPRRTLR